MEAQKNKRAVIYCRVSTKEQVEEGNSLASQKKTCLLYAKEHGYDVVEIFIEQGESAKTQNRTELQKLFRFCADKKNNIQAVIAYKIDRISRNTDDYSQIRLLLKRYHVEIKSTSEHIENTPAGRFMENMLANVAQFDNDVRTERSVNGMKDAMREGRHVGKAPFGYANIRLNGKSNIIPSDKAWIVQKAFAEVARNDRSVSDIRVSLQKDGMVNRSGRPYSKSQFYRILENEVYAGWIRKFGERHKGLFEPLISQYLFEQVQTVLQRRSHKGFVYQRENPDFPLRRFVFHPDGKKLTGYWAKGRQQKYPYYRFRDLRKTDYPKDALEIKYKEYIDTFKLRPAVLQKLRDTVVERFDMRIADYVKLRGQLKDAIRSLAEKQNALLEKNLNGTISDSILKTQLNLIEEQISEYTGRLETMPSKQEKMEDYYNIAEQYLKDPGKIWAKAGNAIKLRLQWFEFPHGVIFENGKFRTNRMPSIFNVKSELRPMLSRSVRRARPTSNKLDVVVLDKYAQEIKELAEILKEPKPPDNYDLP
jgi:DNA invertase Pin-like site-specific DNA recombinase